MPKTSGKVNEATNSKGKEGEKKGATKNVGKKPVGKAKKNSYKHDQKEKPTRKTR
jgi:hypothetical protein